MTSYLRDIGRIVDRRTLWWLLGTSMMVSLLEALSVSMVIPALTVVLTDRIPPIAINVLQSAGIVSAPAQKLTILLTLALVFLLRAAGLSAILFHQSRLVFTVQTRLSNLLYGVYLQSRFENTSKVSTSTITRSSTTELSNLTLGVLLPMALLCSELALVLGAAVVLVLMQPSTALWLIMITAALSVPVFMLNRQRLSRLGSSRHQMEEDRARLAQELTSGIREVKVYGMESQLLETVDATNATYARVMTRINFLQNFPRIYFEAAALFVLLCICGVQLYLGVSSNDILAFLMLSGFAAFRALPSVAKILSQLQALRFYRPSLTSFLSLLRELGTPAEAALHVAAPVYPGAPIETTAAMPTAHAVRVVARDASYSYDAASAPVFQHASFELRTGQIVGLVGPSGVGKSTLLDCIIGLRTLTLGSISIVDECTGAPTSAQVAYVPQTPVVFDGSVWRNLTLAQREPAACPAVDLPLANALDISGFGDLMKARGMDLSSRITECGRNLSGGQRQRLALTRALVRGGHLLVMDEATSALDNVSEQRIFETIRRGSRNYIVIVVTHRPELLQYCDQVIEMRPGGELDVAAPSVSLSPAA
jgi:ABC-type multidrug transport system fused ATPase/permease subunit